MAPVFVPAVLHCTCTVNVVFAPGANTTFTVQVQCSTAGTKTGAITIQNNDGNENPYDVALQALVGTVDFSVSVTPGSMRIRRGTSITATVRVTGASDPH